MADKVRVHELAKRLGISNNDLLSRLRAEDVEVSSHLASIDADLAAIALEELGLSVEDILGDGDLSDAIANAPAAASEDADSPAPTGSGKELHLKPPINVKDLADNLGVKPHAIISELMTMNILASINQNVDVAVAEKVCRTHGVELVIDKREKSGSGSSEGAAIQPEDVVYDDEEVTPRPPVVAFLGHVDHGKTSLQDAVRKTNVTAGEAGGITQHIGASQVNWKDHAISFIDTPGHEAFTAMRARGANTTDIAVLVVAADDGFMPQTIEAISHAKAAEVPIIVAINKMDLPAAQPDNILMQMQQHELASEDWGGEVGVVRVSAMTGDGLEDLLERIVLEAELLELKANPKLPVKAVVLESELEQGMGATVSVLVKNGTVAVGDNVICGQHYGRVKALLDNQGKRLKKAGPSTPVKIVGLSGVAECGNLLVGCKDDKQAKRLAEQRLTEQREADLRPKRNASLEDLFRQIQEEARQELKVVLKTDVQGTSEAVTDTLGKIESDKIRLDIIHSGVGAISESDVLLAAASDAIIVGFHVRVNPGVNKLAKKESVEIRLYSVIYELAEQMKEAMIGMLEPELREEPLGKAEILQIFDMSKSKNKVCGCSVSKGVIRVGAKARVYRESELIYNGSISSLRRFKDDVKEVRQGFECGIRLDYFNDFQVSDVIDVYEYKEVAATL